MTDDKVINAFGRRDELPENPLERRAPKGWCHHPSVMADVHTRTIECAKCQAVIDPFDFVQQQAGLISRAWEAHRQVYAKVQELNESVDRLKREERRLKDRVKRAQANAGIVVVEGRG